MTKAESRRAVLVAEKAFQVGQPLILEGLSPGTSFAVVFEDDGETGYLYGLDTTRVDRQILDALHVYNVKSVVDREVPSTARIMWSGDGLRSLLFINDVPHAGFDFVKRRGYCRTNYPAPSDDFSSSGHEWSDEILEYFK